MGRAVLLIQLVFGALVVAVRDDALLLAERALLFGAGACMVMVFATLSSLVQLNAPNEMRGRVMSLYMVAFRGGMPLGSLAGGWLATLTSAPDGPHDQRSAPQRGRRRVPGEEQIYETCERCDVDEAVEIGRAANSDRPLGAVTIDSRRRSGTLTPHEMLCHLGDATAMVLRTRPRTEPVPIRHRFLIRTLGLWAPIRWPHGWPTNPLHDPRAAGTRPSDFARDMARAIAGLEGIAGAASNRLEPVHGLFGVMSVADWQRWAYRHTDHHLRQFGA